VDGPPGQKHLTISRRSMLKLCLAASTALAVPVSLAPLMAAVLEERQRRPVIWLSFQECTGCTESLTRADAPTLERLLFEFLSLDYHHTLQAAAAERAEHARRSTMRRYPEEYLLIVDGSVPVAADGAYSTIGGVSNLQMLRECTESAAAVIAVGTCAAFGGLPAAAPNPTGAVDVTTLMRGGFIPAKPLINMPGCPPIPEALSAVLVHYLVFERFPAVDELHRPRAFYASTVHDTCNRRAHFLAGRFVRHFDDQGARKGWCLLELGCRGPVTHNACATLRWNGATSYPIQSGHPCIGCSEPDFWDRDGFYNQIDQDAEPPSENEATPEQRGAVLFNDHCIYCHSPDNQRFRDSPESIPDLLRKSGIRAHRFNFGEDELEDLVSYLQSLGALQ
jgi:hydrogenase small subunit